MKGQKEKILIYICVKVEFKRINILYFRRENENLAENRFSN